MCFSKIILHYINNQFIVLFCFFKWVKEPHKCRLVERSFNEKNIPLNQFPHPQLNDCEQFLVLDRTWNLKLKRICQSLRSSGARDTCSAMIEQITRADWEISLHDDTMQIAKKV